MKLFVVVDYLNDFVNGVLGFEGAENLDPLICKAIGKYNKDKYHIVELIDTHYDNNLNKYNESFEGIHGIPAHCIYGETGGRCTYGNTGTELYKANSMTIEKNGYAMSDKGVAQIRHLVDRVGESVDEVVLCGLVTNICVISNAIMFHQMFPDAEITILENLCDSYDKKLHQSALDVMNGMGFNVKTFEE